MGFFDFLKKRDDDEEEQSWEEKNAWDGNESMTCPRCGGEMTKRYNFSAWWCPNCRAGLEDDDDDDNDYEDESLSVYEAADIWLSNGKDEDYMFGYSEEELEEAARQS